MKQGQRLKQITDILGRKPNRTEYRRIWARISRDTDMKDTLKLQRSRHLNHSFNLANKNRKFCEYCNQEGRM